MKVVIRAMLVSRDPNLSQDRAGTTAESIEELLDKSRNSSLELLGAEPIEELAGQDHTTPNVDTLR